MFDGDTKRSQLAPRTSPLSLGVRATCANILGRVNRRNGFSMIDVYIPALVMTDEQYKAIDDELHADGPPAGMKMHSCFREGTKLAIFDVWESQEAFEALGETDSRRPAARSGVVSTSGGRNGGRRGCLGLPAVISGAGDSVVSADRAHGVGVGAALQSSRSSIGHNEPPRLRAWVWS